MSGEKMKLIELEKVNKTIKGRNLLTDVTLTVDAGSITTLEGINGSGKTLILKAMLGLIKTSGKVLVSGQKMAVSGRYPIRAGVLIENPSVLDEFSAFKNLKLIAELIGDIEESEIIDLLMYFNLPTDQKNTVKKFSLGMRQKLGIAQAMLGRSELIVLDEPTNALDETSVQKLIDYIKVVNHAGSTFVVTSHDRDFLNQISTKRIKVKAGSIDEAL